MGLVCPACHRGWDAGHVCAESTTLLMAHGREDGYRLLQDIAIAHRSEDGTPLLLVGKVRHDLATRLRKDKRGRRRKS